MHILWSIWSLLGVATNFSCFSSFKRKESHFSFHVESGQGASKQVSNIWKIKSEGKTDWLNAIHCHGTHTQALRETDNRVSLIWKHQLMQFNNISDSMASAVVAAWPSPAHLLRVSLARVIAFTPTNQSVYVCYKCMQPFFFFVISIIIITWNSVNNYCFF